MGKNAPINLSKTLTAALEHEPRINLHRYPIQVSILDGVVCLEGTVENIVAKKTAHTIACRHANGHAVLDRLRVAVNPPLQDGALRDQVVHTLFHEPAFNDYGMHVKQNGSLDILRNKQNDATGTIEIHTHSGIVTLEGEVGSLTHRRLAEVLVWWTAGCQDVDNRLRVTPPERENEGELADAVRIVLEKDPLVHADQILVRVQRHTVTLKGYLASREERKLAVLDTWYVPGVREVMDCIESRN